MLENKIKKKFQDKNISIQMNAHEHPPILILQGVTTHFIQNFKMSTNANKELDIAELKKKNRNYTLLNLSEL